MVGRQCDNLITPTEMETSGTDDERVGPGALAPDSIGALHAIGADKTAALAREALALAGDNVPWSDDAAQQVNIGRLPIETKDKLNELDQAYYASSDDLTALLYKYVSAHKREWSASRVLVWPQSGMSALRLKADIRWRD